MTPHPGIPHRGRVRGWDVNWNPEARRWSWADTGEPLPDDKAALRPCKHCGQWPTPDGHDACLGSIRGATSACCGHGADTGYVAWPGIDPEQSKWQWLASVRVVE